jgi:beta-lactamase regulating signal transducer with metallopeptidase domain
MEDIRRLEIVEREGQSMGVLVGIVVTAVGVILLFVTFLVVALVRNSLPVSTFTAAQNTTLSNIDTNVSNVYQMLGILLIVGVVVTLIGAIIGVVFLLRG